MLTPYQVFPEEPDLPSPASSQPQGLLVISLSFRQGPQQPQLPQIHICSVFTFDSIPFTRQGPRIVLHNLRLIQAKCQLRADTLNPYLLHLSLMPLEDAPPPPISLLIDLSSQKYVVGWWAGQRGWKEHTDEYTSFIEDDKPNEKKKHIKTQGARNTNSIHSNSSSSRPWSQTLVRCT